MTDLKPYRWFGEADCEAVLRVMERGVLSAYSEGVDEGGPEVEALEREWEARYCVLASKFCE